MPSSSSWLPPWVDWLTLLGWLTDSGWLAMRTFNWTTTRNTAPGIPRRDYKVETGRAAWSSAREGGRFLPLHAQPPLARLPPSSKDIRPQITLCTPQNIGLQGCVSSEMRFFRKKIRAWIIFRLKSHYYQGKWRIWTMNQHVWYNSCISV